MAQEAQKFWDEQATRYDEVEKQFAQVYTDILPKTGSYLTLNDNVLDYGCATGTKTIALAAKVNHIHGLDFSAGMIYAAMNKVNELKLANISFSQGTIYNSDLGKESFDKIIAFAVIHLLEDPEEEVRRIYGLLKTGGIFISTTACMKEKMGVKNRFNLMKSRMMHRLGYFPLHIQMFDQADVVRMFEKYGFHIVETEKISYGMPAIFIVARK